MAKFIWKISKKTVRLFLRGVEITVALIIVLSGLLFWRLSVSPINVDFLVPDLREHLVPKNLQISIDVQSITLGADIREYGLIHLTVQDLTILRQDGSVISSLPEIELSYGLWRILTFNYVPDSLTIKDAFVQAILDKEGKLYLQSKDETPAIEAPVAPPVQVSDFDSVIQYLVQFRRLFLDNSRVVIDNQRQQRQYSIPRLDLLLEHNVQTEHEITLDADVSAQDSTMNVMAHALFDGQTHKMPFEVNFKSLMVSKLGRLIPAVSGADISVGGSVLGTLNLRSSDKNIRSIVQDLSFKIQNEAPGNVNLPAPLTNDYKVDEVLLQGAFTPHLGDLKIDKSYLKTGQTIADLSVDIVGIGSFLDTQDLNKIKTVLKSTIKNVKTEQVPYLWPSALGPTAHAWVKENLSEGALTTADFTLYFTGDQLVDLFGDIKASGVMVDYLNPMQPVKDVAATVHLYPDKVEIFASSGKLNEIKLQKADLYLTDLDKEVSKADISIQASGPVQEVMALIDSQPLEFAKAFQINPKDTGGTGAIKTKLNFPLVGNLDIQQVQVDVQADIENGIFPTPIPNEKITDGRFHLSVNNQQLVLNGDASFQDIPLNLKWTENFKETKSQKMRSIYYITGNVTDKMMQSKIPDIQSYVTGTIPVKVDIQKDFKDKTTIRADLDLTQAMTVLYPIAVTKDVGIKGDAVILTDMIGSRPPSKMVFDLNIPDVPVDAKGTVDWSNGFSLKLDKVVAPQNHFSGHIKVDTKGNSDIKLTGDSWNMTELFEMPLFKKETPVVDENGETKEQIANVQIAPPDILLDVDLERLIMVTRKPLKSVQIRGKRKGYQWSYFDVSALGRTPLEIHYIPQTKALKGENNDLGDLLARVNATERFFGGQLRIDAKQDAKGSFVGDITVRDFNLKDPGFIIQAVTILGIVDGIRGKELTFKTAKIPFELTPYQNIYIENGHASGTTLGLTFKGRVSMQLLDLTGQVIPAYFINSLPGKIPLIGNLFKDGDGGGLVGVRYVLKGTPFNPIVQFNPLKSIAPGVLGVFFND